MIKNAPVSWSDIRQHVLVLRRPAGLGDNCWNVADVDLSPCTNPPGLKYESYSKPEVTHFRLRIICLLSIVTQPLQSQFCEGPRVKAEHFLATEWIRGPVHWFGGVSAALNTFRQAARMANEQPPNLVQLAVGYFGTGTLAKR